MLPSSARVAPSVDEAAVPPTPTPAKATTKGAPETGKSGKKKRRRPFSTGEDPRWDTEGFNRWCASGEFAWVKVAHLRGLDALDQPWCVRSSAPAEALHVGAPPHGVRLYSVADTATCLLSKASRLKQRPWHSDRSGARRRELVRILDEDGAADEDLVFEWFMSTYQHGSEPLAATVQSTGTDIEYGEDAAPAVMLVFEGAQLPGRRRSGKP
jgi:hypothetical protein